MLSSQTNNSQQPRSMSLTKRFLSIQSHVVSGYCGNKSATFPLQLLEFEVDFINSVQLSNHTQYKITKGQIFTSKDLEELASGLVTNNLLDFYDHILTGYVADISYVTSMGQLISDIKDRRKKLNLDCCYTFDPVLGDDGTGFYVPNGEMVAQAYRDSLIPLADVITPNRFEASALSGLEIETTPEKAIQQAIKAIDYFHDRGVKCVIITSFEIDDGKNELTCILSYRNTSTDKPAGPQQTNGSSCATLSSLSLPSSQEGNRKVLIIKIPKLDCPFTGTGDLFAALISAWLCKTNFDLKLSLENTANTINAILEDTFRWFQAVNDGSIHSQELRLVQNKKQILQPEPRLKAEELDLAN